MVSLGAGTSIHSHMDELKAELRQMMSDDAELDVDLGAVASGDGGARRPRSLLQAGTDSAETASMEDYIKDSEAGLSAALGANWTAERVEADADRSTRALLRGISGPKTMGALRGLLRGL